jgi:hypothetical protein
MGATDRIVSRLVPEWVEHQQQKAKDYNSSAENGPGWPSSAAFENADVLGIKGQFAEIWRKIWKLKKGMWDGETLVGEQPREILLDLIGHAFLAIDMIDRKEADHLNRLSGEEVSEEPKRLRDLTGHRFDGCWVCVTQRESNPGMPL